MMKLPLVWNGVIQITFWQVERPTEACASCVSFDKTSQWLCTCLKYQCCQSHSEVTPASPPVCEWEAIFYVACDNCMMDWVKPGEGKWELISVSACTQFIMINASNLSWRCRKFLGGVNSWGDAFQDEVLHFGLTTSRVLPLLTSSALILFPILLPMVEPL